MRFTPTTGRVETRDARKQRKRWGVEKELVAVDFDGREYAGTLYPVNAVLVNPIKKKIPRIKSYI